MTLVKVFLTISFSSQIEALWTRAFIDRLSCWLAAGAAFSMADRAGPISAGCIARYSLSMRSSRSRASAEENGLASKRPIKPSRIHIRFGSVEGGGEAFYRSFDWDRALDACGKTLERRRFAKTDGNSLRLHT
ncbi:hypothetical protein [Roseiarcus sp.]|uniref:hypothetical protein n=1 Tax=Roseiarcus sp. TaxID=1969460 RepID=UPI003C537832